MTKEEITKKMRKCPKLHKPLYFMNTVKTMHKEKFMARACILEKIQDLISIHLVTFIFEN